jgi:hypothetical protein
MKTFLAALGLVPFLAIAQAGPKLPANCLSQGFTFKDNLLVLHTAQKKQAELYLFSFSSKTTGRNKLLLTHPHISHGVSAGWDSPLQAGNSSAFLVNRPQFAIQCDYLGKNYQTTSVACAKVLQVCRFKASQVKSSGTFWAAENQPLASIIQALKKRGILSSN